MEQQPYKIGYIDEDPQQVKRFTRNLRPHGFEVIGYEFFKNMTPESLMEQVYNSDIDLLLIDYKLKESNVVGFNGDVIENLIYNTKPLFPHIIFTSDVDQAEAHVDDWKIIYDKGDVFVEDEEDTTNSERFVKMLIRSIEQYRKYVDSRKHALSLLLQKGEADGLNAAEKNEVLSLQDELNNLDKSKKEEIPRQLISIEKLENLAKNRKEAEEFLQTLINKSK
ncbi:hypothetical protein AAYQ05_14660 [Flavobacterium sp. B11]|uniref:hypothetical protein n=1 Tax=Flavobacterium movens TaxID=214860 RepID=UPI0031D092B7